ncbi:hypothetical protein [Nostoc sp.]|uniref:hypothetical protein n=1 Tax=Nostoc sp. TaxID=1180 RepID=UPI002FFD0429
MLLNFNSLDLALPHQYQYGSVSAKKLKRRRLSRGTKPNISGHLLGSSLLNASVLTPVQWFYDSCLIFVRAAWRSHTYLRGARSASELGREWGVASREKAFLSSSEFFQKSNLILNNILNKTLIKLAFHLQYVFKHQIGVLYLI